MARSNRTRAIKRKVEYIVEIERTCRMWQYSTAAKRSILFELNFLHLLVQKNGFSMPFDFCLYFFGLKFDQSWWWNRCAITGLNEDCTCDRVCCTTVVCLSLRPNINPEDQYSLLFPFVFHKNSDTYCLFESSMDLTPYNCF